MRLSFFVLLVAITFALSLEKKNQELSRTNGVLLQALRELTTSNEAQAEKAVADPWGSYSGPSKDCYSFNKNCNGCRGYLASCCSDKNCAGGRQCKAGVWSYSCDNTAEQEAEVAEDAACYNRCRQAGGGFSECSSDCGYAERAVGNSQCDHINDGNKSYKCNSYYKKIVKCDICQDDDASAVDNSAINDEIRKQEESVGFYGTYKCLARNNCISECQEDDSSKSWYGCMKECPKSLCDKDAASESMDPEDEEDDDSEEEAVGLTCSKDGFEGTVTSDSWCDKRDGVWMHKCSDCKHGYYWYWWHTYCCTRGKSGCTCAYN